LDRGLVVILVTTPDEAVASEIVERLLGERLIACANIVKGVRSIFTWKGGVEDCEEFLVLMKSRADLFEEVCSEVKRVHPYEVPEIVGLPLTHVDKPYSDWVLSSLKRSEA